MKKNGNTICLGDHEFPCGLHPTCPHTKEQDASTSLEVSKVTTDELFEMVAESDADGEDGNYTNWYINSDEFENCEWLVYDGLDGGFAVELIKDEIHINSVCVVESWLGETVRDLSWALEKVYYDGNGDGYWYEQVASEEEKEELRQHKEEIEEIFGEIKDG